VAVQSVANLGSWDGELLEKMQ